MSGGPGRISSTDEFDLRLDELRRGDGDASAYEADLRALAADLEGPVGPRGLLKLARLGWETYPERRLVATAGPVAFAGRRAASLPDVPRTRRTDGPRTAPATDESPLAYSRELNADLGRALADRGLALSADESASLQPYVAMLCRPDFRRRPGWERSLDAHALAMLAYERACRAIGFEPVGRDVETALFEWLHLATYDEVTPEHLAEVAARREVRQADPDRPATEVATMTCEVSLGDLPIDDLADGATGVTFSREQLLAGFAALAGQGDEQAARLNGLEDPDRLELVPRAAQARGEELRLLGCLVHGHLLRWLLDHEVPVNALRMSLAQEYAERVVTALGADRPGGPPRNPVLHAHLQAMVGIRREVAVGLAEELLLLAWLADQARIGLALAPYLDWRDAVEAPPRPPSGR